MTLDIDNNIIGPIVGRENKMWGKIRRSFHH